MVNYTEILEETEKGYKEFIPVKQFDDSFQVFGAKYVKRNVGFGVVLDLDNLRMGALYNVDGYCMNEKDKVSEGVQRSSVRVQDNSGKNSKLKLVFKGKVNLKTEQEIMCSISEILGINSEYMVTENGVKCFSLQVFQDNQTKNQVGEEEGKYSLEVYFLKNYQVLDDSAWQIIEGLRVGWEGFARKLEGSVFDHSQVQIDISLVEYQAVTASSTVPQI